MGTNESNVDISLVDNNQLAQLHSEILELILNANISYYSAIGLLELVKQDIICGLDNSDGPFFDDEDDDD